MGTWHFPVVNLTVPQDWTVAGVTLRPVGWLSQHVRDALDARTEANGDAYRGWLNGRLAQETWSTAGATGESLDDARGRVQDAIALLRFYQRTALLYTSMERQTFGLADEIHPSLEWYLQDDPRAGPLWGGQWHGVVAPFEFPLQLVEDYPREPLFAYLDAAFLTPTDQASDWQRRFVSCLRVLGLAAVLQEQHLRQALLAMALEVLLGDRSRANRGHLVAKRSTFLTCSRDSNDPGTSGNPVCAPDYCFYLTSPDERVWKAEMKRRAKAGQPNECTPYWWAREISLDRNEVLHEAVGTVDRDRVANQQFAVDRIVRAAVSWVVRSRSTALAELVAAMPR